MRNIKKRWKLSLVVGSVVLLAFVGVVLLSGRDTSDFPDSIKKKANFSIFYPDSADTSIEVEKPTVAYSQTNKGLSYQVYVDDAKVVVSEQATPEIFNENGVYSYKLSQAHQFISFDTSAGQVTLTRPTGSNGQVLAWVNSKQTLMLAQAYSDLSVESWKKLFNSMNVVN